MNKQAIIQEVYKKHGIGLSETDPVFAMITINDLALTQYLDQFQTKLEEQSGQYADQIKKQATQHRELSVKQANNILDALNNDFSNAEQQFRKTLTEVGNKQVAAIREAGKKEIQTIANSIKFMQGSLLVAIAVIFFLLGTTFKVYFQ